MWGRENISKDPPPKPGRRTEPIDFPGAISMPRMNPMNTRHPVSATLTAAAFIGFAGLLVKTGYKDWQRENLITWKTQEVLAGRAFVTCPEEGTSGPIERTSASRPQDINDALHLPRCIFVAKNH